MEQEDRKTGRSEEERGGWGGEIFLGSWLRAESESVRTSFFLSSCLPVPFSLSSLLRRASERLLHPRDEGAHDFDPGVVLVVRFHQGPRRDLGAGAIDHVAGGL